MAKSKKLATSVKTIDSAKKEIHSAGTNKKPNKVIARTVKPKLEPKPRMTAMTTKSRAKLKKVAATTKAKTK